MNGQTDSDGRLDFAAWRRIPVMNTESGMARKRALGRMEMPGRRMWLLYRMDGHIHILTGRAM